MLLDKMFEYDNSFLVLRTLFFWVSDKDTQQPIFRCSFLHIFGET